jgi:hypothetical protein
MMMLLLLLLLFLFLFLLLFLLLLLLYLHFLFQERKINENTTIRNAENVLLNIKAIVHLCRSFSQK